MDIQFGWRATLERSKFSTFQSSRPLYHDLSQRYSSITSLLNTRPSGYVMAKDCDIAALDLWARNNNSNRGTDWKLYLYKQKRTDDGTAVESELILETPDYQFRDTADHWISFEFSEVYAEKGDLIFPVFQRLNNSGSYRYYVYVNGVLRTEN